MLHTPLSDYKNSSPISIVTKRAQHYNCNTPERKNALEYPETSQATPSRGTTTSGLQRSLSFRSSSFSKFTGTPNSKKVTTHEHSIQPYILRHGRRYLRDVTLPYPLPCDLTEIHRQTLRTMLLCQVFNGPLCSPFSQKEPPTRVLEVGCGSGYWSEMCYRHFCQQGYKSVSFTGIDIAPPAIPVETLNRSGIDWCFVQHDLRQVPLPFKDEEFSLVMIKDLSMVTSTTVMEQKLMEEYLRILKPGGTLEIWDGDHTLRMLLPYSKPAKEEQNGTSKTEVMKKSPIGTYLLTSQTSFAAPKNPYINEYNTWISKALGARDLTSIPCTTILPLLIQESEALQDVNSRRLAIPLGKVRWENDDTDETEFYNEFTTSKGKAKASHSSFSNVTQNALRRTALMTVIQMIESLEPILREASGKDPDEWDYWMDSMMNDLLQGNGASWGECLEVGAWWAQKRVTY